MCVCIGKDLHKCLGKGAYFYPEQVNAAWIEYDILTENYFIALQRGT